MARKQDEPVMEDFWLHHLFRLHGIPPHVAYEWTENQKRYAYNSLAVQLEQESGG